MVTVIAGAAIAGLLLTLLMEQAAVMWGNRAAAKRRRQRLYPLPDPAKSTCQPAWQFPATPMPPQASDDDLEAWFRAVRQLFREDQHRPALPGPYGKLRALPRQTPQPRGKHGRREVAR
jgi:hypothetical protein